MSMRLLCVLLVQCCYHGMAKEVTMSFGPPQPLGGPPVSKGTGGKMSNTMDLYPDGFASGAGMSGLPVQSIDGGKTFQAVTGGRHTWAGFAYHTDAAGHRWAHDWGTLTKGSDAKSFSSKNSSTFKFQHGKLVMEEGTGPALSFTGLPRPTCKAPKDFLTFYAAGHVVLPDGTHLQSGELVWCGAPFGGDAASLVAFHSKDGYNYAYVGNISRALDVPGSEGPNEHDLALLGNGSVLCVMRTGAGDGKGGYAPFYKSLSNDGGRTWSKPVVMPSMGCARPHLVQLGDVTILSGGRTMMSHVYNRGFNLWMSQDNAETWEHASGTYHHNAKASITGAPLWPGSVNKTGWRFEYTSGYVGLVRVAQNSAMVLYDYMVPPTEDAHAEKLTLGHNVPYSFGMRIDVVPKTVRSAVLV